MNSTLLTAVILLGITFLFILLFSYLHKRSKKKEAAIRKAFLDGIVAENKLQLTEKEELGHICIALDTTKGKLMYIHYYHTGGHAELVYLKDIQSAKVDVVENQLYDEKKGKPVVMDRQVAKVQLVLTPKNGKDVRHNLPFYQAVHDAFEEQHELKSRAQYWQEKVNTYLKQEHRVLQ